MMRTALVGIVTLLAAGLVLAPTPAQTQTDIDWTPPTTRMPAMPTADELAGNWQVGNSEWFRGLDQVSGLSTSSLRPTPEGRGAEGRALYLRFNSGHMPVTAWTDRSGDGRADLIEIFRNGRAVVQLVDSNYSGRANVLRIYDRNGSLAREQRYE